MSTRKRKKRNGRGGRLQMVTLCISTSLVLILLGLVVFTGLAARNLSAYVKENLTVTVMFEDNVSGREAAAVCRKLRGKRYVAHLEYVSREQALKEQTAALGADPSEFLGMNPFVPSAEINLLADCANADSLRWIAKDIKGCGHVAEVTWQKDLMDSVNSNIRKVTIALLVLACLLTFISFSLVNNMVRLGVYARRFTINTMKLVGASWAFIRRPFIGMAIAEGLLAGVVADGVLAGGAYALFAYEPEIGAVVTWDVLAITGGAVMVFGLVLSVVCVYVSVNHYLGMPTRRLYRI